MDTDESETNIQDLSCDIHQLWTRPAMKTEESQVLSVDPEESQTSSVHSEVLSACECAGESQTSMNTEESRNHHLLKPCYIHTLRA